MLAPLELVSNDQPNLQAELRRRIRFSWNFLRNALQNINKRLAGAIAIVEKCKRIRS